MSAAPDIKAERAACMADVLALKDSGDGRTVYGAPATFATIWNAAILAAADAISKRDGVK